MKGGSLYIAVYDIGSNRERNRLAKVLEGCGIRIQKSAFELRLSKAQRQTLLNQIQALQLDDGWVAIYRIDETATQYSIGKVPPDELNLHGSCFID